MRNPGPTSKTAQRRTLATGAVSAAIVANTYRPFASHGYPTILTWLAGFFPSELPLPAAAVTALAAGRTWTRDSRGPVGLAGLGMSSLAVGGLLELHRQARGDKAVLDAALRVGLGSDQPAVEADSPRRSWRTNPLPHPDRRLVAARDVSYGPAGRRNLLDVWRRPGLPLDAGAPVLLQIHGGAWVTGSKLLQAVPLMDRLTRAGWVCVAINYRLSPRATWPDHIVDVKRAIAWIRDNIAALGGDPTFLAVTGGSAGGHLAAVAALTPGDPELQPGFEDADTTVQAAIPLYGAYDIWDRDGGGTPDSTAFWERHILKAPRSTRPPGWRHASPVELDTTHAPPFFVLHGAVDALVPVEGARLMVDRLRAESTRPVCYAELPRARHAFDVLDTARTAATTAAIQRFLDTVRMSVPR